CRARASGQAGDGAGLAAGGDARLLDGGGGFRRADGVDQVEFELVEVGHRGLHLAGRSGFVTHRNLYGVPMGRLALAIPLVLLAGCGAADGAGVADCRFDASTCAHFEERAAQLQWVRTADAERDAEAAIAAGNPPIIGLYG